MKQSKTDPFVLVEDFFDDQNRSQLPINMYRLRANKLSASANNYLFITAAALPFYNTEQLGVRFFYKSISNLI